MAGRAASVMEESLAMSERASDVRQLPVRLRGRANGSAGYANLGPH